MQSGNLRNLRVPDFPDFPRFALAGIIVVKIACTLAIGHSGAVTSQLLHSLNQGGRDANKINAINSAHSRNPVDGAVPYFWRRPGVVCAQDPAGNDSGRIREIIQASLQLGSLGPGRSDGLGEFDHATKAERSGGPGARGRIDLHGSQ
jgi:hypothetical protein